MKKSELKFLIREVIEEVRVENQMLEEGFGSEVAKQLIVWLLKKLKNVSPETFDKINVAIQSNNKEEIDRIFNSPDVKKEKSALMESLMLEADEKEPKKKEAFLKRVWGWIKNNPKISADVALALIGTLIGLYYTGGDITQFLHIIWPNILKSMGIGAIAGAAVTGGTELFNQYKEFGSVKNWKDVGKQAAKGIASGVPAGLAGGTLGAVGSGIAHATGAIAAGVTAKASDIIAKLGEAPSGKRVFDSIYKYKDDTKNFPYLKNIKDEIQDWKEWIYNDKSDSLSLGDLEEEPLKSNMLKLLRGDLSGLNIIRKIFNAQHAAKIS